MRSITDLFIRRPVLAIVVNLLILIAGVQAIRTLNVRQYPRNENATVTVTTVYVGASADLVRGFITAPLERAIAGADGIDYLESQSALSVSTITAHLKLNQDSRKALAEIASKVDQVRGDLPPAAQVPIINIESADSQFASCYLSFSSDILQQNEITDYLVRVVQPRLSALGGVQRADILGGRTFAMRIWLKPDRMAALERQPRPGAPGAGGEQLPLRRRPDQRLADPGQPDGQHRSPLGSGVQAARDPRGERGSLVRLDDIADVVLGAEDYNTEVRFSGQTAVFMGVWVLPNSNSLDVIKAVRGEIDKIQADLPTGMKAVVAYDATGYIRNALSEVFKTLMETLLIVMIVIFLFLGSFRSVLVPVVAIPVSLIGAVFLMQVFGFTVNLLTLLAIVLSVGLVVDDAIVVVENVERRLREGNTPLQASILGARELHRPDHRDDDHAGDRVRADRPAGRTHRLAVPRVRVHAGRGGHDLGRRRADAFAGHVLAPALRRSGAPRLRRAHQPQLRPVPEFLRPAARRDAERATGRLHRLDRPDPALLPDVHVRSKELAPTEDQGVIFGIIEAPANATIDQTVKYANKVEEAFLDIPETAFTFQLTFPDLRLRRRRA